MKRAAALAFLLLLPACSAPQSTSDITIPPGRYIAAFDAAKDTLSRYHFELERVDARAGVITTKPKTTGGLATPWDREQTALAQEWEDLLNDQRRTVRITFEAAEPQAGAESGAAPTDLRQLDAPFTAHIDAVLERIHHSGWRLEPSAIRFSTLARDPALEKRALWPTYAVAFSQDPLLSHRLADAIRRRLASAPQHPGRETQAPLDAPRATASTVPGEPPTN